jgi:hypothetical protein
MNSQRFFFFGHSLRSLALIGVLLISACDRQTPPPPTDSKPGDVKTFTGRWSATGDRQTMQLESDHEAIIFRLTGSMLLAGQQRLKRGFKADLIGFSDSLSGMQGRSVWTDERGDKVFSELHGEPGEVGRLIEGRFIGGTGRYASVSGEYTFRWKHLINNENGKVSGRAVDLQGWARLGVPDTLPSTIGSQQ